ncbi:MAG: restriction endonuclease subunit S [Nitrospira sp.]|nr:restriction endonuclease subunit S [Nitrospira sp.]MDH4371053.1 restriction endonuclease subunit S [Nitrospira sp.]MDH5347834.1 restriction endonuclease subunit S [Nitrospira sp.]MDH5498647.1 restriction endonuclease subunit S [Nitrospira sp.]MDH5724853.1 restriction endonuclease subunit S [Nitrospira sp.]
MTAKKLLTIDESSLPEGWKGSTLADVAGYIQRGKGPKYIECSDLPVINQKCIRWFGIQKEHLKYVDPEQWNSWGEERYVRVGDVLWNSTGAGTIGRAALVKNLVPGEKYVVDSHVTIIRPKSIDPQYVHYWIMSPAVQGSIESMQSGSTNQVELSKSAVEALPIPVAPPEQQKSIVAEIEKQFSRLDEAVANLKRVKANLKRYKASVLKAAVEGKLTEDWRKQHPNIEPAASLISRTPAPPRPNRWNSRSKDVILGHSSLAVGNPGLELPSGWTWAPLVDIARMESGHTPSREHPEWWEGEVSWIGIADAREHDGRVIMKTLQHTNKDGLANSAARLLPSGTVCVSRTASLGYVVVLGRPMATSQDFVNWIPTGAVTSEWLRVVFSADREALRRFGKGSVHKTIYFPEWLSIHIGVPPILEQVQIVAEVDRRLSVIEELEATVEANHTRAERLRQAILSQAFTGKLVFDALRERPA